MPCKKKWTTRDGRKIRICDMTDYHLTNTIDHLQRLARKSKIKNELFYLTCPQPHGDMAIDAFDHEVDAVAEASWQEYVNPLYWDMLKEAEERKLEIVEPEMDMEDCLVTLNLLAKHDNIKIRRKIKDLEIETKKLRKMLK
jgi:hypothetical protein